MPSDDQLYGRLNGELERIYVEIRGLRVNQHIFWEVQRMIRENPNLKKPSSFYGWMGNMYAAAMPAAVRRLIDLRKDSVSFIRLLEEVKNSPSCFSREAYKKRAISINCNLPLDYVNGDYDKLVGKGSAEPDPTKIANHIRELKGRTETLKRFVDEHVAHLAKEPEKTLPTFQDLDDAIDLLEKLVLHYMHLFRGVVMPSGVLPTWQYDWKEIFRYPWNCGVED